MAYRSVRLHVVWGLAATVYVYHKKDVFKIAIKAKEGKAMMNSSLSN